jgi:60 kDa SS-A/Ro ribonucleoprotein
MSSPIGAMPVLSCAEAAAALAMIIKRTEKQSHIFGFSNSFRDLKITAKDSLEDALEKTADQNFGGTDCALPMIYAQKNQLDVDCFVVITDSETWDGGVHPFQALKNYRQARGINAKLIVLAMTANEFTIADQSDPGMLDVVGYDSSVLDVISEFVKM